jgi:hypothetical protein
MQGIKDSDGASICWTLESQSICEKGKMKTSRILWVGMLIVATGILHDAPALGQGPSCYVSPSVEKTHIFVRELDPDGNPVRELDSEWSGWVNLGGRVPIASRTGRISISYRLASSDKDFMMDPTDCSDGIVISVP